MKKFWLRGRININSIPYLACSTEADYRYLLGLEEFDSSQLEGQSDG